MPQHQQGVAASMLNTAINWSISLGLGIAGTIESEMGTHGRSQLDGYRAALYAGIVLSGLGILVALIFCRVPKVPLNPSIPNYEEQNNRDDLSNSISSNDLETIINNDYESE